VKFWGAAAGVASTMSCPPLVPCFIGAHWGR
jgi:hypothetical protein